MNVATLPILQTAMNRAAHHFIPFQVSIEVTHRCNLRCKHCYIDVKPSPDLTLPEMENVLDQLAEAGTMYLMFTGGEVFTRKDFLDILSYAKSRGFLFYILSNGTLINTEIARELAALKPIGIAMSIYGAQPETHDAVTGKVGSFQSLMDAINTLQQYHLPIKLQSTIMDSNVNEMENIKLLAQQLNTNVVFTSALVPGRTGSLDPIKHQAEPGQLCSNMAQQWLEETDIKESTVKKGIKPCKAGRGICSISANGDVFPCLIMPMKLGNIKQTPFMTLWHDSPADELVHLRSLTSESLTKCKSCSISQFCNVCLGVAYSETGTLTRPAPSTCHNATLKSHMIIRTTKGGEMA